MSIDEEGTSGLVIKASEIVDEDSLTEWLAGQPDGISSAIAIRAALRVLPIALSIHQDNHSKLTVEIKNDLTLQVFRANFISWVAREYLTHDIKAYAAARAAGATAYAYAGAAGAAVADAAYAAAGAAAAVADAAAAYAAGAAAADAVADAAYAAVGAADAADAYAAGAAAYAAVRADAKWLENKPDDINALINQPLWLEPREMPEGYDKLRNEIKEKFNTFRQSDLAQNTSFGLIADWYGALLPEKGKPRSLFGEKKDLELATQPEEFWEGEAQEVMNHVAELVRPPVRTRFFISYSSKDEVAAKFIGGVIEDAGYQVFAQYKDMPAGSVFIEEMKRGLASADRFVPVLSPNYEESDFCQAEWNAAYHQDPLGVHRKLLPFLISQTKLNEFASTIVYTNLINQEDDERREAILNALDDGGGLTRKEQRKKLAASASPQIVKNEDNQLDTAPNEEFDQPINDPALVQLLADILKKLEGLCLQFEQSNRSSIFKNSFTTYRDEIKQHGVELRMGELEDAINIIKAEIAEDEDGIWYKGGVKEGLDQFLGKHQELYGYYPKAPIRQKLEENADVNEEYLSNEELDEDLGDVEQALRESAQDGKISTDLASTAQNKIDYFKQLKRLEEMGQPIVTDDSFVSEEDKEQKRVNDKKKWGANIGSLFDNMLARAEKINSIANSDTGKGLMKAAAKIVSKIWWDT